MAACASDLARATRQANESRVGRGVHGDEGPHDKRRAVDGRLFGDGLVRRRVDGRNNSGVGLRVRNLLAPHGT